MPTRRRSASCRRDDRRRRLFVIGIVDMDHVANPDALLKALDGPVVKYVR